ncbi:MAG: 3-phosphoglycerate dehydrogenase family protein [Clostridia bacterium]|nr:3-phosphoglycerate dehydrogenase family protein [Clostridia bacterium]
MYNVKTLNKISKIGLDEFTDSYTVSEDCEKPEAILVRSAKMHDYAFNPELVCIARAGAGVNNIPCDRCSENGIVVFNTPGANANGVKELVLCALLLASRDVVGGIEWVKKIAGTEDIPAQVEKGKSAFVGPELQGKSLGVIGLGAIGAKIANDALSLGMKVFGYDPYLSVEAAWRLSSRVIHATDLDTIYANCDYITIHVPYMPSTKHTINAEAIAKMKDGVRIINLARGELVDDNALLDALENGKVARYVTDFPNDSVAGVPGVIAIPHLGASTPESEDNCAVMAAGEIMDYVENGNIANSVNMPRAVLPRTGNPRIGVIHKNIPEMIAKITTAAAGVNIEHMVNAGRGDYAYTLLDLASLPEGLADKIKCIDGVIRVRIIG